MLQKTVKTFVALCIATLIFSECSDSSLNPNQSIVNKEKADIIYKSQQEQFAYVTKNLQTIQHAFLSQTQNADFKKLLYSEIEKQFDGDENVLLEQLFKMDATLKERLTESRFINQSEDLEKSLNAFQNIGSLKERYNLFPQIYIHNFFNLKAQGFTSDPVIVTYNGDESEILNGVRLNKNGEVEKLVVDEAFANQNEVWVISLNEKYKGEPLEEFTAKVKSKSNGRVSVTGDCFSTPVCNRDDTDWADLRMDNFMIACAKEGWGGGDSDVSIARWAAFENFIDPDFQQYRAPNWIGDPDWVDLLSVDEYLLSQCFEMDYIAYQGFNPDDNIDNDHQVKGDIFFFVIFEHDNWPVGVSNQQVNFINQGYPVTYTSLYINYRSSEGPYSWAPVTAKPIYRNCSPYFGCGYYSEQACDSYIDYTCSEVNWKTGS